MDTSGISVTWWVDLGCAQKLISWAKSQGMGDELVEPDYLHCTVMYDTAAGELPPRWDFALKDLYRFKPDFFALFGDHPSLVLNGQCRAIQQRQLQLRMSGYKSDFPFYRPHLTLAKYASGFDTSKVHMPDFPIYFSHETSSPISDDVDFLSTRYSK